jgi:hypothetical protein
VFVQLNGFKNATLKEGNVAEGSSTNCSLAFVANADEQVESLLEKLACASKVALSEVQASRVSGFESLHPQQNVGPLGFLDGAPGRQQ